MTSRPAREGWTPFSNGTEFHLWADENCWSCIKGWNEDSPPGFVRCPLEDELFRKAWTNPTGKVSP